MKQMNKEN